MEITFSNIIDLISNSIFGGSTTLAGLAIMLAIWAVCTVIYRRTSYSDSDILHRLRTAEQYHHDHNRSSIISPGRCRI